MSPAERKQILGQKQRRTPRRVYRRSIGVLHGGEYRVVQASQLSEGGLVFQSPDKFAMHDQVVASLILPGGGVVVARGEISLNPEGKANQFSIKFKPLALQLRRLIRNYVSAKTQAEAELEAEAPPSSGAEQVSIDDVGEK